MKQSCCIILRTNVFVQSLYSNTRAQVLLPGGRTPWFGINTGLRQGCVLSPLLFDIFGWADHDAQEHESRSRCHGLWIEAVYPLLCRRHVLLAESRKGLQQLLDIMPAYLRRWRLEVNMEKTKVVIFGDPGNGSTAIKYGDEFVKEAEEYKYLGNVEASFSAKALNNIWKGLIQPHLEYGAEVMDTSPRGSWTEAEKIMTKMGRVQIIHVKYL